MTVKMVTFADIQISNILFYDPDLKDECYKFCVKRNIDCLPALNNQRTIHIRDDATCDFVDQEVKNERIVDAWLNIFEPNLLEKFAAHPLLLVFSNDALTGVVHFSDYNQSVVSIYLYEVFLNYEKALRNILSRVDLDNRSMIEYFYYRISASENGKEKEHYNRKIKEYEKKAVAIDKLPKFQAFYLKDLIEFAEHKNLVSVENKVNRLRNMVMHAHEFVNMENPSTHDLIYDFKKFKEFFELAVILHKDYKRVKNILAFKSEENHA